MLTRRATFIRGLLAGMSVMVSSQALHWLLTPMSHRDASSFRHGAVVVQLVAGVLLAIWLARGIPGEPEMPPEPTARQR